jgi:hypothetical protein
MMKRLLILSAASLLLFSCKKDKEDQKMFIGSPVQVHGGKAWTWLRLNKQDQPEQLAVTIDDAALNSMPDGSGNGGHDHMENIFILPLHPKVASTTPFKTVAFEWAPEGHPPANVYTVPHFDFHFYMMTAAEVAAATDPVKLMASPAPHYLPANYVGGNPVPQMGQHWIDVTSPELHPTNPAPFTQTFIYGSYDSKVNFYEPMITKSFLQTTQNFERNIPQPEKFQQSGYYPTKMRIIKHNGKTEIILDAFVFRVAS